MRYCSRGVDGGVMPDSAARHRIIVADDHPVFRDGIRRIVQGVVPAAMIHQASTFDEVLDHARNGSAPDVFVLDLLFPGFELGSGPIDWMFLV